MCYLKINDIMNIVQNKLLYLTFWFSMVFEVFINYNFVYYLFVHWDQSDFLYYLKWSIALLKKEDLALA